MKGLHRLLNWRLLRGSHEFPGPDGGTCISEAAVMVAGFEYRKIGSFNDCPPCFSRPISSYAIRLNDAMPDDIRQELLLPFAVRLAGTADTLAIERQRTDLIIVQTVSRILPIVLHIHREHGLATMCEAVTTRQDARDAARTAHAVLRSAADASYAAYADVAAVSYVAADAAIDAYAAYAADASVTSVAAYAAYAADAANNSVNNADYSTVDYYATYVSYAGDAISAAHSTVDDEDARFKIWTAATEILDAALRIGRQADPIEADVIIKRAEASKRRVVETV